MLRLLKCGYNYIHREGIWIDRPSGSGDYAFVFFRSDAQVIVRGQAVTVEKNSFIMFRPNTPHAYGSDDMFVNDWLHCNGDNPDPYFARIQFPLDEPVQSAHPASISRNLMELYNAHRLGGPLCDEIINFDLHSLFAKLSNVQRRAHMPKKANPYFYPLMELRNEMYSSPMGNVSVSSLAKRVNLSQSYFQHMYKELFGCPVTADLINGRLEYAKYLLNNSSLSVKAVAKTCGYENETHFMRQFKKLVGTTPGRYSRHS